MNKTIYVVPGYFTKSAANALKKRFSHKTYMNLEVIISNYCGNYCITIATDYDGATEEELRDFFMYLMIEEFGRIDRGVA